MARCSILLVLALTVVALGFPANKKGSLTGGNGSSKDLLELDQESGPLEEVSKVLDRYARQVAQLPKKPNGQKGWTPLHRAVLRGALQVTKQLLGYDGWTPNHLELLKGERETLLEHIFDDNEENEEPKDNEGAAPENPQPSPAKPEPAPEDPEPAPENPEPAPENPQPSK